MRDYPALVDYIDGLGGKTFGWSRGELNCVTVAAGAIKAQTRKDKLRGLKWKDEREARALLTERGGMVKAVSAILKPIAPAQAHRGDIGGVPSRLGGVLLVVIEGQTLVGIGPDGLRRLPRKALTHAWSAS